jgi:hypothetical protein
MYRCQLSSLRIRAPSSGDSGGAGDCLVLLRAENDLTAGRQVQDALRVTALQQPREEVRVDLPLEMGDIALEAAHPMVTSKISSSWRSRWTSGKSLVRLAGRRARGRDGRGAVVADLTLGTGGPCRRQEIQQILRIGDTTWVGTRGGLARIPR